MGTEKVSKSNPVAIDLKKQTVTITLYASRVTRDKNDNPKNTVFEIAGAMDKAKAQRATYNLAMVYGDAGVHEIGDLVEVTIKKLPKSAA